MIPKSGIKYYYRVNLWKDGVILKFSDHEEDGSLENLINRKNSVLEVYVPPKNMAFVHRNMVNKSQCKKIDRKINHGEHTLKDLSDKVINFNDIQDGLDKKNIRADSYLSLS